MIASLSFTIGRDNELSDDGEILNITDHTMRQLNNYV